MQLNNKFSPNLKAIVNIQNTVINSNWDELDQEYIDCLIYGIIDPQNSPGAQLFPDISLVMVEINQGYEYHLEHAYIFRVPAHYTKEKLKPFLDQLQKAALNTWAEACIYQESVSYLQTTYRPKSQPNQYNYLTYIVTPDY